MAQIARNVNGKHTEILIQTYSDRVLVLVTQLGKVANLVCSFIGLIKCSIDLGDKIQASIPPTAPLLPPSQESSAPNTLALPTPSPAIHLTPLLGSASSEDLQTLHSLYAAQIATIIWTDELNRKGDDSRRSVVVGLALAKVDDDEKIREVFQSIMSMLLEVLDKGAT
ncbi:hypothetical protein CVT24_007736 [Panaeolus cyanescens]|uniref:Proteasome assembly chaperone 3 n=1 Tax=Panaeolus cyanescens TaxID=181874 RepID=A0A409YKK5_9AGAR|nr:hypothetical protein CVT24_007736 [Panaeolus cyanescens]